MEILLVENDHLIRDQIKVGLQQFPEFHVTCGEGYSALNEARQKTFSCIFLGIGAKDKDGLGLIEHLRSFDRSTEVVVVTTHRQARDMAQEKSRNNISAFVHTPLDVTDFFRFIGRFRERRSGKVGLQT